MGKLSGKVAFITGISSGMGEACAKLFASEGARIAGFDVQKPSTELQTVLDESGQEPYPQQAAINGNVVVARIGENWSRFTIG